MGNAIQVMLVDDDAAVADLTATYLERTSERIEAVVETEPTDGLDRITGGERVDCVVSDYEMPAMNGLSFLDEVRSVAPELPFMLFTGRGSEEIASEAISAGVTDYLQKGTGTEQYEMLANRIENAVEQSRARREADEANEQIRRIFERITDAFYAVDDEWRLTYANQQAAAYTDHTQDELVGMDVREVFSTPRLYDAYERAFGSQEPVTLDAESTIRPGRWTEVRIYPDEDGLSVYFRDVTERKRAQMELRETKQKREALYDVAVRTVSCTTADDIYDLAIEAAEDILEFDLCTVDAAEGDVLVTRSLSKVVPTDGYYETTSIEEGDTFAARAYREGEPSLIEELRETDVVPAESEYRSALTVPLGEFAVFQAVSKEVGGFDDDDRELAELLGAHLTAALARVTSEQRLRTERDRFAALFENVPNPVVRYGYVDGVAVGRSVNPAFEEVFGWDEETIVGESVDDYVLPADRRSVGESLNTRVADGDRIEGTEVYRTTREGGRDFLLHTAPAGPADGDEAFAIYVDITEQKERERKLTRQNERLEEFASVVSHDLRNPLNVALGHFDLLADESDSDHLDPLGRSLDRMDALVEDLLAMARQGQIVDEFEPVALADAVEAAWETVDTGESSVSLAADAVIETDAGRFRELLENLFRNAVEHGSTGRQTQSDDVHQTESDAARQNPEDSADAVEHADRPVTVEVGPLVAGSGSDQRERGFYVADDGPGIPESEREAVFDHGYTTDDGGTGFGLGIVSSIAEAHGWDYEITESESGGARFEFTRLALRECPES